MQKISVFHIEDNTNVPIALREDKSYKYGFNGMERDDEVKGSGNHYQTYFRMNDARLGRWLSRDPISHPWESSYTSMANNPIFFTDFLGASPGGGGRKKRSKARKGGFLKRKFTKGRFNEKGRSRVQRVKKIDKSFTTVFFDGRTGRKTVSQRQIDLITKSRDENLSKFAETGNVMFQENAAVKQRLLNSINQRLVGELNATTQNFDEKTFAIDPNNKSKDFTVNFNFLQTGQFLNVQKNGTFQLSTGKSVFSVMGSSGSSGGTFFQGNVSKGGSFSLSISSTPAYRRFRDRNRSTPQIITLSDGTIITTRGNVSVRPTLTFRTSVQEKR